MAKNKKSTSFEGDRLTIIKYRWECIRLSQDYIKAYHIHIEYIKRVVKEGYRKINDDIYENRKLGKYTNVHPGCHPFEMKRFLDPKYSFSKLKAMKVDIESCFNFTEPVYMEINDDKLKILRPISEFNLESEASFINLNLWIDLKGKGLKAKRLINNLIDRLQTAYHNREKPKKFKNRFEDYDEYLRVYKFMKRNNDNVDKTAQALFPNEEDRDYAKTKVNRYYERANFLINEKGFLQIN